MQLASPNFMRKKLVVPIVGVLLFTSCSPRDYLTRRLAADLIAASEPFKQTQQYVLQTGVVSNQDYSAPEYVVLQHHGWISATTAQCRPNVTPAPCWDVVLTPSGVEAIRPLVSADQGARATLTLPVARRKLLAVTGISRLGTSANVDFTWRWGPLNEIGAALYSGDLRYRSTVAFREYDDGWRVVQSVSRPSQSLDDSLRNAEPAP